MGAHDRISPDPAISRHELPNGAPAESSGTRHSHQNDGYQASQRLTLHLADLVGTRAINKRTVDARVVENIWLLDILGQVSQVIALEIVLL
jgi:hypothetical protein